MWGWGLPWGRRGTIQSHGTVKPSFDTLHSLAWLDEPEFNPDGSLDLLIEPEAAALDGEWLPPGVRRA